MLRQIAYFLFIIAAVCSFPAELRGQPNDAGEDPFLEWIDADSALVITIDGLDSIVRFARSIDTAANPYLAAATDYLFHPDFPLVHPDRRDSIGSTALELLGKIQLLEKIVVVVHKVDVNGSVDLTLMIDRGDSKDEPLEELGDTVARWLSLFENASSPLQAGGSSQDEEKPDAGKIPSREFRVRVQQGWLLVSNSELSSNSILDRMHGVSSDFRVVAGNRRFQMINKRLSGNSDFGPSIRVMGNPKHLRALFPEITDHDWNANQIQELTGFGLQIALPNTTEKEAGSDFPSLIVEATVNLTVPHKGIAAVVAAHKPIDELPRIGVVPHSVHVYSFDPQALHNAKRDKHDAVAGKPEYDAMQIEKYKDEPRDYFRDVLPRTDLKCTVLYQLPPRPDDDEPRFRLMVLERALDSSILARYLARMIEGVNSRHGDRSNNYVRIVSENRGELWAVNPKGSRPGVRLDGRFENCMFRNDKWLAIADINGIEPQIDALSGGKLRPEAEQFKSTFQSRLECLERLVPSASSPYDIEHKGNTQLHLLVDLLQDAYVTKHGPNGEGSNRAIKQQEPDELGITIRPECRADVGMIVNLLVRKAIIKELGDLLVIQSYSDSYWHGAAACFPAWEPEIDSAER